MLANALSRFRLKNWVHCRDVANRKLVFLKDIFFHNAYPSGMQSKIWRFGM